MLFNGAGVGYAAAMSIPVSSHDLLTPFMLENGGVRGRVVHLGAVSDIILSRYEYPAAVRRLLGELLGVVAMLSANLKQEGIFTIQIRGARLVPLVVVDAVYGGALRGYAELPPESMDALAALATYSPRALVGEDAYLTVTFDPGEAGQRYQGIVALEGDSIAEALTAYFTQSEQLDVALTVAISEQAPWSVAGMLIERLPDAGGATTGEALTESWNYGCAMLATVTARELLDPLLDAQTLLYRLFHEEGVWVYDPTRMSTGCRCSRERISKLLMGMSANDRADMIVDGAASVHCQFCNKTELFTPAELGISINQ